MKIDTVRTRMIESRNQKIDRLFPEPTKINHLVEKVEKIEKFTMFIWVGFYCSMFSSIYLGVLIFLEINK